MKNQIIRDKISIAGLLYWEVAEEIGISPYTLSVWLRKELSGEKRQKVENAIEAIVREKEGAAHE